MRFGPMTPQFTTLEYVQQAPIISLALVQLRSLRAGYTLGAATHFQLQSITKHSRQFVVIARIFKLTMNTMWVWSRVLSFHHSVSVVSSFVELTTRRISAVLQLSNKALKYRMRHCRTGHMTMTGQWRMQAWNCLIPRYLLKLLKFSYTSLVSWQ